jgi:hypothetical protein
MTGESDQPPAVYAVVLAFAITSVFSRVPRCNYCVAIDIGRHETIMTALPSIIQSTTKTVRSYSGKRQRCDCGQSSCVCGSDGCLGLAAIKRHRVNAGLAAFTHEAMLQRLARETAKDDEQPLLAIMTAIGEDVSAHHTRWHSNYITVFIECNNK